jgi:hypothetical protein
MECTVAKLVKSFKPQKNYEKADKSDKLTFLQTSFLKLQVSL